MTDTDDCECDCGCPDEVCECEDCECEHIEQPLNTRQVYIVGLYSLNT